MATLKIKRGVKADLDTVGTTDLGLAELGYCTDTKELYIGNGVSTTLIGMLILDEDDLDSDSALALATQQSVKAYSDNNFLSTNYTYTTDQTITVNDADFVVRDTTDTLTQFIWRDHSAGLLYLGSENATVVCRSNVGVGTDSPEEKIHFSADGDNSILLGETFGSAANIRVGINARKARGTKDSPLIVASNDQIYQFIGQAYTGTDYESLSYIRTYAETVAGSDDDISGALAFGTRPEGVSKAIAERIRITSDGNVGMGTISPQEKLAIVGNIVLPKTSGSGIKIDNTTPTFGWRDLLGDVTNAGGASKPTNTTYRGGITQFQFGAGDESIINFHIPHDYVHGTDIYLHIHWSHNSTLVTGGTITFTAESAYSKGHNQAPFTSPVTGTFTGAASTTQYQHIISETQYSASSPTGLQLDTDDLEPDGVIMMRLEMTTNSITSSGAVPDPFIHYIDVHYQSTSIPTKDKTPNFYT